jgi:hypothetical protein
MKLRTEKMCFRCKETLPIENFYKWKNRYSSHCRECEKEIYLEQKNPEDDPEERHVYNEAGKYADEHQFKMVYEFITKLGWLYNQDTNVFYKEPIKDMNGKWYLNESKLRREW